jgi:hypothetical protein
MKRDEQGIALVAVLMLMGVLSVVASSLVFVSQTETWASQNYRLMTEARYGAESGVHRAAHFLMYSYAPPLATGADPISSYTLTTSPVQAGGGGVVLSSTGGSNYPVSSVVTAYTNAVSGTLQGGHQVAYNANAFLVGMRQVAVYGQTELATVQVWRIVGEGTIGGAKPARASVEALLERQVVPTFNYAAFATNNGCGALTWSGGGQTDSYDSGDLAAGFIDEGGNVGTNGNLTINGGTTDIGGSLSTPRTGVGNCTSGGVTALSGSINAVNGMVELPQPVIYPPPTVPVIPAGSPDVTFNNGSQTKAPGTYGNISFKGELHLSAGVYNVNSFEVRTGGGLLVFDSVPVIINVAGFNTVGDPSSGYMNTPFDLTGQGSALNTTLDPTNFQVTYAGTGTVKLAGGADVSGLMYAPNADITNNSAGANWYGAVIGRTVTDAGHAQIHYDRRLQNNAMMLGAWMMDSFSWPRF